jgi:hypothetical protein
VIATSIELIDIVSAKAPPQTELRRGLKTVVAPPPSPLMPPDPSS